MRTRYGLAAAAVAAAVCALAPLATALDGTPVNVDQTVTRTEGRCVYTASFRGHYRALPADSLGEVHIRDAVVDVDARVQCRGEAPSASLQQVYYAGGTEQELLARLAEVARIDHQVRAEACAFVPSVRREGDRAEAGDVRVECHPAAAPEGTHGRVAVAHPR